MINLIQFVRIILVTSTFYELTVVLRKLNLEYSLIIFTAMKL